MDTPTWYKVSQKQLDFREFLERYNDPLIFTEKYVLPIFIFSCLQEHEPYVSEKHILMHLLNDKTLSERALKYVYLYWIFSKKSEENLLENTSLPTTLSSYKFALPSDFSETYIYNWIQSILESFFSLSLLKQTLKIYSKGNMEELVKILEYVENLKNKNFILFNNSIPKSYSLYQEHCILLDIKKFLNGESFPEILHSFRDDVMFFQNITYMYFPRILKTLDTYRTFNSSEIDIISNAHQKIRENGDIDFLFSYINLFLKSFGNDTILSKQLLNYLNVSKHDDYLRTNIFMKALDPSFRRYYIPQILPISDKQLAEFIKNVKENGFEETIKPYILFNKKLLEEQMKLINSKVINEETITTQTSIYLYSPLNLVFVPDNDKYYVFLNSEIDNLRKDKKNPYTRSILPEYIFKMPTCYEPSQSLEQSWSNILKRNVDLKHVLSGT